MIELIAEVGWNHMGNMNLAYEMIKQAAKSGADYVKFQTWDPKKLCVGPWDIDGRREMYEKAFLSECNHYTLKEECTKNNVKFLTSCFCIEDLNMIRKVTNEIKIPSHECRNILLIKDAIKKFDRVFLSVGAITEKELLPISRLLWSQHHVTVMHCTSSYPTLSSQVNIPRIHHLKRLFPTLTLGYSGHHSTIWDAMMAISHGVKVIEKHFTIDRELSGRDNKLAILPNEFSILRDFIVSKPEEMLKDHGLDFQECEKDIRENYAGRWG